MADKKRYQVASACVIVPVDSVDGTVMHTLYRGMVFESDPDHAKVVHNVESGYIVPISTTAVAGTDAAGEAMVDDQRTVGDGEPGSVVPTNDPGVVNEAAHRAAADAAKSADDPEAKAAAEATEVEARREAARAKLPADGSAPHHNAGEDVWREYAVSKGMDRAEVEKASKDDLKAALKS